jgi:hypothetical protein
MKRCVSITCDFDLAIGKVNLDEIVYRLKELRDSLMLRMLKEILVAYDDLIMDRLTQTKVYPSKMRKGLGRHVCKDDITPLSLFYCNVYRSLESNEQHCFKRI